MFLLYKIKRTTSLTEDYCAPTKKHIYFHYFILYYYAYNSVAQFLLIWV